MRTETFAFYLLDLVKLRRHACKQKRDNVIVKDWLTYAIPEDVSVFIPHILESLFYRGRYDIIGVIYGSNTAPKSDLNIFSATYSERLEPRRQRKGSDGKTSIKIYYR